MSNLETFTINPSQLNATSFYPRNYKPNYILVKNGMNNYPCISDYIQGEIKGGSTPPAHFFYNDKKSGIPFIKTAAITRHIINVNDLQTINETYHKKVLNRSIIKPYDVIFTMTGKFMGKAAMCPKTISEMNMSQNSVVFHTKRKEEAAFLTIFLNSEINRIQIKANYSITKQKYLNQGKIANLHIIPYNNQNGVCPQCGEVHNRDHNAALNLRNNAISFVKELNSTVGTTGDYILVYACGGVGCRKTETSMKQEDIAVRIS